MTHAMHQGTDTVRARLTQLGALIDGLDIHHLQKTEISAVSNARAAAQTSITNLFDRAKQDRQRANKELGERQSATLQRAMDTLAALDRKLELNQKNMISAAGEVKTDFDGFAIENTIRLNRLEIREAYVLIPIMLSLNEQQTRVIRQAFYGLALQIRRGIVQADRLPPMRRVTYMFLAGEIDEYTANHYAAEINCASPWTSVYGDTLSYIDKCVKKIELLDLRYGQLTSAIDKLLIAQAYRTSDRQKAITDMIFLLIATLDEFIAILLEARKKPLLPEHLRAELVAPVRT